MTRQWSNISLKKLRGVHPDLIAVMRMALIRSTVDFRIIDGVRTIDRQRRLIEAGKSQTMQSRHLRQSDGYGHAVDVVALPEGRVSWDWQHYQAIHDAVVSASDELGINIVWGGSWRTLRDGVHFELEAR